MNFIDLAAQQACIKDQIDEALQRVLAHGEFILGPEVFELEEKLAEYTGAGFCITCGNGTDALQIALMALRVGSGDEIITSGFSYIAAAEAAAVLGAIPVFVDIQPDTYNLDAGLLEASITERTKAIIAVSLFGQPADMQRINEVARRYNVPVIEDAAQSFGADYRGRTSCNLSLIATTSFFPSKPLGCYGDGGAIFTSDETIAQSVRQIRQHGQTERYVHERIGINSRLDTIQAAILLVKLTVFDKEIESRREIADRYSRLLDQTSVRLPQVAENAISVWAQYTIGSRNRDALKEALKESGIPTAIYYPLALNSQKAVRGRSEPLRQSQRAAEEVLSLPMHPYLSSQTQERICAKIAAFSVEANQP